MLAQVRGALGQAGDSVDDVDDEVETVEVVEHDHVERRGGGALLLVAAHVDVVVVGAPIGQAVDQQRVAVVGEDHGPVGGEQRVELVRGEAVRMLAVGLQTHQIDDVHHPHLQLWKFAPEDRRGGDRLERRHVAGAGEHDVGLRAFVV